MRQTALFDGAIEWLASEDKNVIAPEKRSFRLRLKEPHAQAAGSSSAILSRAAGTLTKQVVLHVRRRQPWRARESF